MYDYISLHGDSDFSSFIDIDTLKEVFRTTDGFQIKSNASAIIKYANYCIIFQGIKCDQNGSYAFDDDSVFKEINLIEITIPQGAESEIGDEIRQIAKEISIKIGWQIDWRE